MLRALPVCTRLQPLRLSVHRIGELLAWHQWLRSQLLLVRKQHHAHWGAVAGITSERVKPCVLHEQGCSHE